MWRKTKMRGSALHDKFTEIYHDAWSSNRALEATAPGYQELQDICRMSARDVSLRCIASPEQDGTKAMASDEEKKLPVLCSLLIATFCPLMKGCESLRSR